MPVPSYTPPSSQGAEGSGYSQVSHNLGVIARVCDKVGVMYAGEMIERAAVEEVFLRPLHPYTQGLMRCVPKLGTSKASSYLYPIPGRVPSSTALPPGCIFEPRCGYARQICQERHPELREIKSEHRTEPYGTGHFARCHFAEEIIATEWQLPEGLVADLASLEQRADDVHRRSATLHGREQCSPPAPRWRWQTFVGIGHPAVVVDPAKDK